MFTVCHVYSVTCYLTVSMTLCWNVTGKGLCTGTVRSLHLWWRLHYFVVLHLFTTALGVHAPRPYRLFFQINQITGSAYDRQRLARSRALTMYVSPFPRCLFSVFSLAHLLPTIDWCMLFLCGQVGRRPYFL